MVSPDEPFQCLVSSLWPNKLQQPRTVMSKCHLLFGVINSDFSSKFNASRTPSNNQNGTS
ncbi:unnamed protein product [Linum tenue]|uniref:Uncharacterized protein n=1 Tax=Linum tenue TaxID=586396 RepID=A0AAV0IM03_9ROSI|nr:unnamed protein product [Linum tenue]